MRIRKIVWFSLFLLSIQIKTIAQSKLSLKQAIETAIANNIDVKQSGLQNERTGVNLRQAKGDMLPSINGNIEHTLNQGRSIDLYTNSYINQQYTSAFYSLSGDLTLFNGLRLLNNLRSNQFAYEASRMEWQQTKDRVMLDVMLAYLEILTNTDLLEQARKSADVTQKQVDRLKIMNEQGAIKPSDLSDLQGQLGESKLGIINSENNLNASRLRLAQLMGVPYNENLEVERLTADQFDMSYSATVDSIFQAATQQLALIKGVELRKKSAEKAVQSARGSLFPVLGIGAGYYTNYSSTARDTANQKISYYNQLSNNYSTYAGVGLRIPILNGLRARNSIALAKIDLKNAEYVQKNTQIQLRQSIERDHLNMRSAVNRYQALVEQVTALTESFRAAEIRFNAGVGTPVDYLTAKNNLDRANVNLIIARYDYLLRTKILDYYQARPLF